MASSTSILLLLFLITISSSQILARDSQFFSKVTNTPTHTNTVVLPNKEQEQQSLVNTQEQQPEFIPQNQNGYGLYGQENTETMSGAQTQTPGTYASERMYNDRNRAETETEQYGNRGGETVYYSNGQKYQNDDASFDFGETKDQNDDTLYSNNGVGTEHYDSYTNQKDNGEKYYYSNKHQNDGAPYYNNNYNGVATEHYTTDSQKDNIGETETYYSNTDKNDRFGSQLRQTETSYNDNGFTNELNTRYSMYRPDTVKPQTRGGSNVVRQGMSDTRFLENGRYYYDVNMEKQNQYADQNTYKSNYDSQFGNREYASNDVDRVNANYYNNNNRFYDNSGGEKYEFNTMDEYERSRQSHYDP